MAHWKILTGLWHYVIKHKIMFQHANVGHATQSYTRGRGACAMLGVFQCPYLYVEFGFFFGVGV